MAATVAIRPIAAQPAGRSPSSHQPSMTRNKGVRNVQDVNSSRRLRRASTNCATVVAAVSMSERKANESRNRGVGANSLTRARCHPVANAEGTVKVPPRGYARRCRRQ